MEPISEDDLILKAIKKSAPPKKKSFVPYSYIDMDNDILDEVAAPSQSDAIWDIAKKSKPKKLSKFVDTWTMADFIRFVSEEFESYKVRFQKRGPQDSNNMALLHDRIMGVVGKDCMSNEVLKEYLEWWINTHHNDLRGEPVIINRMMGRFDIEKFSTRFKEGKLEPINKPIKKEAEPVKPEVAIDDDTLYEVSGLPALLMKKGIVCAYRVLRRKNIANAFYKISDVLHGFSKKTLEDTVKLTISLAPYDKNDSVDFISLARQGLQYHNLTKYLKLSYTQHFKQ